MTDRREIERLLVAMAERGRVTDVLQDAAGRVYEVLMDGAWMTPLAFAEKARPLVGSEGGAL